MLKKSYKYLRYMLCFAATLLVIVIACGVIAFFSTDYVTDDVSDYGNYYGVPGYIQEEYINRFFPQELLPEFKNVRYHFSSRNIDTYGFEVYLEFEFDSKDKFDSHVAQIAPGKVMRTFYYDTEYQEYILVNQSNNQMYDTFVLSDNSGIDENGQKYYYIDFAEIAKVLINPTDQRIIYVALAVSDGGGTDTSLLCTFFDRFSIDPIEYETYIKDQSDDLR